MNYPYLIQKDILESCFGEGTSIQDSRIRDIFKEHLKMAYDNEFNCLNKFKFIAILKRKYLQQTKFNAYNFKKMFAVLASLLPYKFKEVDDADTKYFDFLNDE